jgi:hypothetical protein
LVVQKHLGVKIMRRRIAMRSALGLALLLGIPVAGQSPFPQFPSSRGDRNGQVYPDGNPPADQGPNSPEKRRMKLLNAERQKSLVTDADKLLKLARELNEEVAQTESGSMSGGQLHKVEEIGKLAKSVKEKMSYSVGGFPNVSSPLTIQPGIQ